MNMRIAAVLGALLTVFAASAAEDLVLAENGKTDYVITFGTVPSAVDEFAARELRFFLRQMTGADFPVVRASGGPAIVIGHTNGGALSAQECRIESAGRNLLLYGGGIHGNLWAVYELLENRFGCMFLNAFGDLHIPARKTLTLPEGKQRIRYAFPSRALMNWFYKDKDTMSLGFYRNRQNLLLHGARHPRYPGRERGIVCLREQFLGSHSLFRLIPPGVSEVKTGYTAGTGILSPLPEFRERRYFRTNPEFFSMDADGKRVPNRQLCFSNPALRRELEKNIRLYYESERKRTGIGGVIEISCNDIAGRLCHCPDCMAQEKEYGTAGAPLLLCLAELAANNPDITFSTLAYQRSQTQHPPKKPIRFPENFFLIFAPINGDFANPLNQGRENSGDLADLKGWTKLVKRILFWYYPHPYNRNPELFFVEPPTSVLERCAADVKLMRDLGVEGPYVELDSGGIQLCTNFSELDSWVMLKLSQNPDQDLNALVRKFIRAYYGPAAEEVQRYHDRLTQEMHSFVQKGGRWNYRTADASFLTVKNLLEWDALLDRAEKKAGNEYGFRVRLLRIGLDGAIAAKTDHQTAFRIQRMRNHLKELQEKRPVNVNWKKFEEWSSNIAEKGRGLPLPPEFSSIPGVKVLNVPENGKTIVRMKEANYGRTFREKSDEAKPFYMGFYDRTLRKHLYRRAIDLASMDRGGFSFQLLNRKPLALTPSTVLYGGSWWLSFPVGSFCCARDDASSLTRKWFAFVSLKVAGTDIFCDRTVLIPADKCPEAVLRKYGK